MYENLNDTESPFQNSKPEEIEEKVAPRKLSWKDETAIRFRQFVDNYARGNYRLTSGVYNSQREIIEDNILDRNFKFAVPYTSAGDEKIFFSLPYIISDAIYRNTNIDTKDIEVRSDSLGALDWLPLIRGAVDNYLKTNFYGTKINEFRRELIDMGHVLVKEVDNETHIVNLLNIIRPPHIQDLQKSGLAERTLLTWEDIKANKEEWKDAWSKIRAHKDVLDSMGKETFIVYEYWTWDKLDKDGKEQKVCVKFLDCSYYDEVVEDVPENWEPYVELERFITPESIRVNSKYRLEKLVKAGYVSKGSEMEPIFPYEEERLITLPGRWMGCGMYELLRPETKAYNKTLNEKLSYDEMLHKGVLVHTKAPFSMNQKGSGRSIESEILSRIQTGTMLSIKAGEKIDRLNVGSLTADFIQSADQWLKIARQKAGVSETAIAERTPSSTSATVGLLNSKQGKTTFDIVMEQQGLFLERLFTKFKLRSILTEITRDEWTKIVGNPDDLAKMEQSFVDNLVNVGVKRAVDTGLIAPAASQLPAEEMNKIKESVQVMRAKHGGERPAQIQEEMIKDFNFYARFQVSTDALDKQAMLVSVQAAIDTVAANPTIGLDSTKLVEKKLELMNIPTVSLRKTPEQIQADRIAAMASVAPVNQAKAAPGNMGALAQAKDFGEGNAPA